MTDDVKALVEEARDWHGRTYVLVVDTADLIDRLATALTDAEAFKAYVHERLDAAGIPTHPDGPHSAAGCRIGDRLDIALAADARGYARGIEDAARVTDDWTDAQHIAHDMRQSNFPRRSPTQDAIASFIRSLIPTQEKK